MKISTLVFTVSFFLFSHWLFSQSAPPPFLLINEIGKWESGKFIELLVVGDQYTPSQAINLQAWAIDNYHQSNADDNIHLVFGDCLSEVYPGTLILLYDNENPPKDLSPNWTNYPNSDGVLSLPLSSDCISKCQGSLDVECLTPSLSTNFTPIFPINLEADALQLYTPNKTLAHAVNWSSNYPNANHPNTLNISLNIPNNDASILLKDACSSSTLSYELAPTGTPGKANNTANSYLISSISNGQFAQPLNLSCQIFQHDNSNENSAPNGVIEVQIAGGTAPYLLTWQGPSSGSQSLSTSGTYQIQDLPIGNYTIHIEDARSCEQSCTQIIKSNTEEAICKGACQTIGVADDGHCYHWEPSDDLDHPHPSMIEVCPDETTTYTLTITNDDGDLIEVKEYTVEVIDPSDPLSILSYFEERGFMILPIVNIKEPALKAPSDDPRYTDDCNVTDHSPLILEIIGGEHEGETFNLGEVLNEACDYEASIDITGNDSFCEVFKSIEESFNNCTGFSIWYHVLDMSSVDADVPDLLIFNHNEQQLYNCHAGLTESISFSGCGFLEDPDDNPPIADMPNYTYRVVQRSFGPWIDFGHLPILVHVTKNNFEGDNRGFSLAEHRHCTEEDDSKVTSRTYQQSIFTTGDDKSLIADYFGKSSGTKGIRNMCPEWVPSGIVISGGIFIPFPCSGSEPCNWKDCVLTSTIPVANNLNKNSLYQRHYGRDECVYFSTNIDVRSRVDLGIVNEAGKRYLTIKGVILNKGFPSHEMFIEDEFGKKVFLYTFAPPGEDHIAIPGLLPPFYHEIGILNFLIEINNEGGFLTELIVGTTIPLAPEGFLTYLPQQIITCPFNQPLTFDMMNTTIDKWNNQHLNKPPAGDCPDIPCCGNLDCCE